MRNGFFVNPLKLPVSESPERIVSVVPSQTELLADLGLENQVVGITKFCVHPESWFRSKTRVGGTKTLNLKQIRQLTPDLILANKEENIEGEVFAIAEIAPVYVSDVNDLESALNMIYSLSALVSRKATGVRIIQKIRESFSALSAQTSQKTAVYLIWKNPWMTVGGDTFIHDMLRWAGYENVFGNLSRYPEVSIEQIREAAPDYLLLSSEPFPFAKKHILELQAYLPNVKIILVDGEMFSWYGSRLLQAPDYFQEIQRK